MNEHPPTTPSPPAQYPYTWRRDRAPVLIGEGIARFRDPAFAMVRLEPFPAYIEQPGAVGGVPASFAVRPRFTTRDKAFAIIDVPGAMNASLYGVGEHAGPLLRNGTAAVLWNNDHFDYTAKGKNLYQSHPFVLGVRKDGSAFGVIIETTYRCTIDLSRGIHVTVCGPSPAVAIIERSDAMGVVRALAELTGRIAMPPRWALGYHQCRWSYAPESKFLELASEFRSRRIPCDCLWFDIDYMDGFRCFTFDKHKFPDPKGLNAELQSRGFKTIYMIDCGIKVDPAYMVYREGVGAGHFITNADGTEFRGEVWPGDCAFPDFMREKTRTWWAGLYPAFMDQGIDGVWNDMNEPAVFKGIEKTMPVTCLHRADEPLGGPNTHAKYHNLYGAQMVRATLEGIKAARPDKRPFVLTRSNFLGGQRYAATWTGDNRSDWNHLRWSISMALNLSLSGQPFVGPDIGGFIGNADGALFARWMGIGALLPFARAHSEKSSTPHEPWSFGEACERTCRLALERRYRLLPYLYTLFHRAAMEGEPIVRPVFFADPANPRLRSRDDAFLLGPDLLVQCDVYPVRSEQTAAAILPGWKAIDILGEDDADLPRLFLRPGAALPLGPRREWTEQVVADDAIELIAHLDDGVATCELYEDDGDGYGYLEGGYCLAAHTVVRDDAGALSLSIRNLDGKRPARPGSGVQMVAL